MKTKLTLICFILLMLSSAAFGQASRGLTVVQEEVIKDLPANSGNRIAICIGVNGYFDNSIADLEKASNDALGLAKALSGVGQFDRIYTFVNESSGTVPQGKLLNYNAVQPNRVPEKAEILNFLNEISSELNQEDMVVFSFSGHGISNSRGEGFLLCGNTSYSDVFDTSLAISDVVDWVEDAGVLKSIFLIDACREEVSEYQSRGIGRGRLEAEAYSQANVSATFYATRTGWYSFEDVHTDYGIFTRFVLSALQGRADYQNGNKDGLVSFSELADYVDQGVSQYAASLGLRQKPALNFNGPVLGDLAISAYSGSINGATRSLNELDDQEDWGRGRAFVTLFSNVDGIIYLDDEETGTITAGQYLEIERVRPGPHYLRIDHDFGVFRADASVHGGETISLVNQHLEQPESILVVEGINFVFVPHGDYPGGGFWMSESELTLGAYAEFVEDTGYESDGVWNAHYRTNFDWFPVSDVSLRDSLAYAEWFYDLSGFDVRIPTADEWAWAAGQNHDRPYPWGHSWAEDLAHWAGSDPRGMLPVQGSRGPVQVMHSFRDVTLEGITSMAGNLREWVLEGEDSADSGRGILAGGSWTLNKPKYFKSTYQSRKNDYFHGEDTGIRLVLIDP